MIALSDKTLHYLFDDTPVYCGIQLEKSSLEKHFPLLVIADDANTFDSNEYSQIKKIVASANIQEGDYAIISTDDLKNVQLFSLLNKHHPYFMLIFSDNRNCLNKNISVPLHRVMQLEKIKLLRTVSLKKLVQDTTMKKALWAGMKEMFNL
ncbi:MAG: hypothetical protein RMJ53_04035 [Chitinophagales bacterium]|nr:hypothetical protein [Chitinophagales bacterium]MDW8273384.1 hypothetical protein [Chitinophagales bacterium]